MTFSGRNDFIANLKYLKRYYINKKVRMMHFDVVITKQGKQYSSWCPQLDIASCGATIEEARRNLKEAIELYLEDKDARISKDESSITLTHIEVMSNAKAARPIRA